jgi:hypothetical protein
MALKIIKHEKESSQNLVRRFSKRVKMSGLLRRARKNRFRKRVKSHNMQKKSALRREEKRKDYEKMIKMGKIQEKKFIKRR